MGIKQRLRPYQLEAAHAILKSVLRNRGLTITVEVARQGGKNELSAQLELLLLTLNRSSGGNLVKAAPTYMPQLLNSIFRLKTGSTMPATRASGPRRAGTPSASARRARSSSARSRRPGWWAPRRTSSWKWTRRRR